MDSSSSRGRPPRPGRSSHRSRVPWGAVALLALLCPPGGSGAQEPVREVQVPVDTAGRVLELTPELRREGEFFPDVRDFEAARLFRLEDDRVVLEVSRREDDRLVRERTVLTPAEADAFRREVSVALSGAALTGQRTGEGRGGLVLGATGLGVAFYGWAVPVALGIDNPRMGVATYLLTAASSFYLPYRLTRDRTVYDAHRSMALWGATRGALYGGTLGFGLTERGGRPGLEDEDEAGRVRAGLAAAGSVAGGLLGFLAVDRTGIDQGNTRLWGTLTDFGTAAGFGLAYVSGLYEEETRVDRDGIPVTEKPDLLPGNLLALAVTGAGLYGGRVASSRLRYTVGDVHVLRSFGLLGAQSLLPLANLAAPDEGKVHAAGAILGAAPGLWLGDRLLRDQAFSGGDGLLVAAGHLAGGLLGAGLTYLVNPRTDRNELIYLSTTALGSAAGLAFTYRALAADPGRSRSSTPGIEASGRADPSRRGTANRDGVRVTVQPLGLVPVLSHGPTDRSHGPMGGDRRLDAPLVKLVW